MSEDRAVLFRQNQQEMITPILPPNVNSAFQMAAGTPAMGGMQNILAPENPILVDPQSIAAKQDSVMNSINAPSSLSAAAPLMQQPMQSDIAVLSNNAMQMASEVTTALFGALKDPEPTPEQAFEADFKKSLQLDIAPKPPTQSFGMGIGMGGGM